MPQKRNSGTLKPGMKIAQGNDKTLRLSTWLDTELQRETGAVDSYGEKMTVAKELARDVINTARTTEDAKLKLDYFKEIADRTEGKPVQKQEITGKDGAPLFTEMSDEQLKEILLGKDEPKGV